jgi:hypothetical protein
MALHNELEEMQGGNITSRYHLSEIEYNALTGSGELGVTEASDFHLHDERYYTKEVIDNALESLASPLPVDIRDTVNWAGNFEGNEGKVVVVKEDGTALEYANVTELVKDTLNINEILGIQDPSEIPGYIYVANAYGEIEGVPVASVLTAMQVVNNPETFGQVGANGELSISVRHGETLEVTSPEGLNIASPIMAMINSIPQELTDLLPVEETDSWKVVRVSSPVSDYELATLTTALIPEAPAKRYLSYQAFTEMVQMISGDGIKVTIEAEGLRFEANIDGSLAFDEEGRLILGSLDNKVSGSITTDPEGKLQLHNDEADPGENYAYSVRDGYKGFNEFQQPLDVSLNGTQLGRNVHTVEFQGTSSRIEVSVVAGVAIVHIK